ncbi:MAG: SDR family oxidoreductase [Ectothiorhodospiraceae bacterium]|nr:SDR family oxidoreductase [Ectothiorhodospiraceae bacterium]
MSIKQLFDLTGRVAMITGGSRGLGLQMAEALGELGAKIAITARKQHELDAAAEQLRAQGVDVLTVAGNLAQFDTIPGMADQVIRHFGPIDILVNNAGTSWGAPAEDYPVDGWNKVMDLNVNALWLLTQYVGRECMIPRRYGKIINIASTAGLRASMDMQAIAYYTSKGAVVNHTRGLASEWGRHNITVNAICPGFFPSKMSRDVIKEIGDAAIAKTPLGRLGGDEDLKGVAALLASDASRHITGQAIAVDGGTSIA